MNNTINQVLIFISIVAIIILAVNFPVNSDKVKIDLLNKKVEQLDNEFQKNAIAYNDRLENIKDQFQDRTAFIEITLAELRFENIALQKKYHAISQGTLDEISSSTSGSFTVMK